MNDLFLENHLEQRSLIKILSLEILKKSNKCTWWILAGENMRIVGRKGGAKSDQERKQKRKKREKERG